MHRHLLMTNDRTTTQFFVCFDSCDDVHDVEKKWFNLDIDCNENQMLVLILIVKFFKISLQLSNHPYSLHNISI